MGKSGALDSEPFGGEGKLCKEVAWPPGKASGPAGEVKVPLEEVEAPLANDDESLWGTAWPPGEVVVPGGEGV